MDPTPVSIPEKILFLLEYAVSHGKKLTTLISFGSLVSLITLRSLKRRVARLGGRWAMAIYLPEVLVVVLLATSALPTEHWNAAQLSHLYPSQYFPTCMIGTKRAFQSMASSNWM